MKIISDDECEKWVSERLRQTFSWAAVEQAYPWNITYVVPGDAGKRTALGRLITALVDRSAQGLLWITEWGVFPSSENMALFDAYRRSIGESRPVHAAPGHVVQEGDDEKLECLLDLSLYFFWDVSLFDGSTLQIALSHDEVMTVNAHDLFSLERCIESMERFKFKELTRGGPR